jgi:phage shock protein E
MKLKITLSLIIILTLSIVFGFLFFPAEKVELNPGEFKEKLEAQPGIVIDVRTIEEYENGHLAIADLQYDFRSGEFENKMSELDRNETYYLYCRTGNRSGQALEKMKEAGFNNVYNIGGYEDLISSGLSPSNNTRN